MQRVLITGGAGALGREMVNLLTPQGYTVRVMSRRSRPATEPAEIEWAQADLGAGTGIGEAVAGVDTIVHAATNFLSSSKVDVAGTKRLLDAARDADVSHVLYVSIVGIERDPFAYYQNKLKAEALVQASGVPWSIQRAVQFYPFIDVLLRMFIHWPVALLPTDFQLQPMDIREAAGHMVESVVAGPAGRLPDIGGPEVRTLGDLAQPWMQARGLRRPVARLPLPGKTAAAFRNGYITCPEHKDGKIRWEEWLRETYGQNRAAASPYLARYFRRTV
ncbi:MAG TPA: NAD(P)H-binding protein [Ktedonobacterales bacterium]|nr:NAD(P)H-binding protein [Ktedonobacterales bacterium]